MKRFVFLALVFGLVFLGCDNGNDNGDEFTASTNETVSNDVATLGLIGTSVSSSNSSVATAEIVSGKIKITSVSQGSAVITVSAGANNATINVTVSTTGSIIIGAIVKYSETGDIVPSELIGTYRFTEGTFSGNSEYDIVITSTTLTWSRDGTFEIVHVTSDKITCLEDGEEWEITYELNGDILRVQDGRGEWQERVRVGVGTSPFTGTWFSSVGSGVTLVCESSTWVITIGGDPASNAGMKGGYTISGDTATFTITHVKDLSGNWVTEVPTGHEAMYGVTSLPDTFTGTILGTQLVTTTGAGTFDAVD